MLSCRLEIDMQYVSANTQDIDFRAIQRIILRLLALGTFCERAATAPAPIRFIALWLLCIGEIVARDYADDLARDLGCWLDLPETPLAWRGDNEDDAIRLAVQFRVLAEIVQALAGYAALFAAAPCDPTPNSAPRCLPLMSSQNNGRYPARKLCLAAAGMARGPPAALPSMQMEGVISLPAPVQPVARGCLLSFRQPCTGRQSRIGCIQACAPCTHIAHAG